MDIIESMNWRYAVKKFDDKRKLTKKEVDRLLEATRLSASSLGLQPYKVIVVESPKLRGELMKHSMGQDKVILASHLLVFASYLDIDETLITDHVNRTAHERGLPDEAREGMKKMMTGFVGRMDSAERRCWAERQAYIAIGTLLAAAAMEEIDACPMEGFSPPDYDRVLGLKDMGLGSVALATLGFRAGDDAFAKMPKVRMAMDDFVLIK